MERGLGTVFATASRNRRLLGRASTFAIAALMLSAAGVVQASQPASQPILNLNVHCNDGDTTTWVHWSAVSMTEVDVTWYDFSNVQMGDTVPLIVHGRKGTVSLWQTPANAYYAEVHWIGSRG